MIEYLIKGIRAFVIAAVLIIFAEVIYEVFSRYVLLQAVPWGAEVSQTLMVWMAFVGAGCAFYRGQHMAIDYLVRSIPSPGLRKTAVHFANACIATLLVCGLISGAEVVSMTWGDRTTALQIPGGIIYLAFPVSMAVMLLVLAERYITGKVTQTVTAEAEGGDVI